MKAAVQKRVNEFNIKDKKFVKAINSLINQTKKINTSLMNAEFIISEAINELSKSEIKKNKVKAKKLNLAIRRNKLKINTIKESRKKVLSEYKSIIKDFRDLLKEHIEFLMRSQEPFKRRILVIEKRIEGLVIEIDKWKRKKTTTAGFIGIVEAKKEKSDLLKEKADLFMSKAYIKGFIDKANLNQSLSVRIDSKGNIIERKRR